MRLLLLGGTIFLGRHLVEVARARRHQVTLFNRGLHHPDLFPEIEKLRGERDGNLSALEGRNWDAVVDTCGYVPRLVRASAELLAGRVGHYTFISSISVYADFSAPGMDEGAPLATLSDETVEEITGETYGALKALCEREVEAAFPGRFLQIRPGLIVGPHDPSDRFTYWPHRTARGGEMLAPGSPERPVQFVDVRDLAEWIVSMIEQGRTGAYNATGPDQPLAMGRLLAVCRAVSGRDTTLTWVDDSFLQEQQVGAYAELPLWVPGLPEYAGFDRVDCSRALAAGLSFRPLAETVRDVLEWDASRPADQQRRAGLSPEREAELLARWWSRRRAAEG